MQILMKRFKNNIVQDIHIYFKRQMKLKKKIKRIIKIQVNLQEVA